MRPTRWYFEYLTPELFLASVVEGQVYSGRTPFQAVDILDTAPFGRALILDGRTQSTAADERLYHETLVHPALLAHPEPRRVLVCGGGEGATLREALRHPSVRQAVMVDIDGEVVELCRRYLPNLHQGAFDDPRTHLHIGDARRFLEEAEEPFDVVICDLADPMEAGPAYLLYTREFYATVRERLTPGGLLVTQAGPAGPTNCQEEFTAVVHTLAAVFPAVHPYTASIPSFGSTWGFALAQREPAAPPLTPEQVDERVARRLGDALQYYDGETHRHLFALPRYLREALRREERLIRDDQPLLMP